VVTGSTATEIIDRLARERGLPREKIRLSDRLLQDIGLDGDDAVNFFVSLQDRFGTDLTQLREHWSEHFRSERTLIWAAVVPIPSFIVAVLVAGFTGSKVWGGAAGLALAAIVAGIMLRRPAADTMVPITVEDVVAAAEAGTWTKETRS
jgi:acyl carrier protein